MNSSNNTSYHYSLIRFFKHLLLLENEIIGWFLASYTIASDSDVRYGLLQTYQDGNNIQPKIKQFLKSKEKLNLLTKS